jgi:hypothetical protein
MKRPSILLLVLAISFSAIACSRTIASPSSPANIEEPAAPAPVEKTLSSFTAIQGTDYLMAGIVPAEVSRDSSLNPFEWINNSRYSYSSYSTYNYVFFNTQTEEYHRLLPTNDYIIYQTAGFPQQVYDPNDPDKPAPVIEFWMYNIVKADTNGDNYFDYRDKLTISLSDVGGSGYTELIQNVDAIQSQYYKDPSNFFIIYNVNDKNFIAKVNPITRQIISTIEMDLGEDVK